MRVPRLSPRERFLFDLNGFLVLRNVLAPAEVDAANAAIDAHAASLVARAAPSLRNAKRGTPMSAAGARYDMGNILHLDAPHCDPFRSILAHPKLVPYYEAICGPGYRLDHSPLVIAQEADSEGFALHGGPITSDGGMNTELMYRSVNGQVWTSLLAVSVQLVDHHDTGGFCVLPGSHKLNFPCPPEAIHGTDEEFFRDYLHFPRTNRGDVVIWSEATIHGAVPWRAPFQRRIALYRFAPANMGYGRGYLSLSDDQLKTFQPLERAVVEPPYSTRLDRPLVTEAAAAAGAEPEAGSRSGAKKAHDQAIFGSDYF